MLPDPLHPALVHFPIVFSILLPVTAVGVMFYLARRGPSRTAWLLTVALASLTAGSTWLAVETGEEQEEVVEDVLRSEAPLHEHEDRADQFLATAVVVLATALLGVAPGRVGTIGRAAATVASLALIPMGIRVGHSGGELVYVHGAAQAYLGSGPANVSPDPDQDGREFTTRDEDRH